MLDYLVSKCEALISDQRTTKNKGKSRVSNGEDKAVDDTRESPTECAALGKSSANSKQAR